jgi:23S rRNA pseudouridine1911/1915/1917 synthase
VLFENARLYVVDKPAHLPVHSSAKFYFNTLMRVLGERYPDEPDLQLVHRLDRETSGCLVIARDREADVYLKHAFETKTRVVKEYLAVVHGAPPASWDAGAVLDTPLRLSQPGDPTLLPHVRMLPGAGAGALEAMTRVRVEQRVDDRYALVRCTLVTGRQHQIRAHLAHAGVPIVGDKLYAHGDEAFMQFCDRGLTPELAARFVIGRHALHAAKITIPDPDERGRLISVEAPLPGELTALLAADLIRS